ncbi:MAG: hypothetical protein U0R49_01735 [Fimbriimonadales bacterium]
MLEVVDGPFEDNEPIFYTQDDPFVIRFKVRALAWLPVDKTVPIHDPEVWGALSFTKGLPKNSGVWTGKVRGSLAQLDDGDGQFIEKLMESQTKNGKTFPIDPAEFQKLVLHRVRRPDGDVEVTVPDEKPQYLVAPALVERESINIQALLADIGTNMGLSVWLPRADRARVLEKTTSDVQPIDRLPLNYDETTLKTVELIDVLWLKGRAIKRAFEVEHSTSIYSGLLRMADLVSLLPNIDVKLHIVAPAERRQKVFQEIRRPVFSLLERGPLSEICTYLAYESIHELAEQKNLNYMRDDVLDAYEERED